MRGGIFLTVVLALFFVAPPVGAQEAAGGPALGEAAVRVVPAGDGVEVTERLVVTGAGGSIEHIIARFGSTDVEDLVVRAGGRELDVRRERGDLIDRVSVPVTGGEGEGFAYQISYTYPGEAEKVPFVVPEAPTAGDAAVVALEVALPPGSQLQDSFPVLEAGGDGEAGASMTSFPSFVSYRAGGTAGGILSASNAYTALALTVIVACVLGLLLYDHRLGRKGATGV